MGGYAFYVWTSWGLAAVALAWLFAQAKIRNRSIKRDIRRQLEREALHNSEQTSD